LATSHDGVQLEPISPLANPEAGPRRVDQAGHGRASPRDRRRATGPRCQVRADRDTPQSLAPYRRDGRPPGDRTPSHQTICDIVTQGRRPTRVRSAHACRNPRLLELGYALSRFSSAVWVPLAALMLRPRAKDGRPFEGGGPGEERRSRARRSRTTTPTKRWPHSHALRSRVAVGRYPMTPLMRRKQP
jgi:hypothetical protein